MPKRKVDEEVRKALKRQETDPDTESEMQTSNTTSGPNPDGNRGKEGSGNPGGHGRGGKASRG